MSVSVVVGHRNGRPCVSEESGTPSALTTSQDLFVTLRSRVFTVLGTTSDGVTEVISTKKRDTVPLTRLYTLEV